MLKEEKTCLLTGNFNVIVLNIENKSEKLSDFFAPYILQSTNKARNSKILIDNIF